MVHLGDRAGSLITAVITEQAHSIIAAAEEKARRLEQEARQRAVGIDDESRRMASQLLGQIDGVQRQLSDIADTLRAEAARVAEVEQGEVEQNGAEVTQIRPDVVIDVVTEDPAPVEHWTSDVQEATETELATAAATSDDAARRRVSAKSDDELAEGFAIGTQALSNAKATGDEDQIRYWDDFTQAVLIEAVRRPTFGEDTNGWGRLSRRERRVRARRLKLLADRRDEILSLSQDASASQ